MSSTATTHSPLRCRQPVVHSIALFLMLVALGTAVAAAPLVVSNVTVIDPGPTRGAERVLEQQTVVVRDGRIVALGGPRELRVSADLDARDTRVVDGTGRFLIPGLWDVHTHVSSSNEHELALFTAFGVTDVRDMGGDPLVVADWRRRIAVGDLVGPTIRSAGPVFESRPWLRRVRAERALDHRLPFDNPHEARDLVALLPLYGAEHLKVRNVSDARSFEALLRAGHEHGLPVAGHEPLVVSLEHAARAGMRSFEHLPFISLTTPGNLATESTIDAATLALLRAEAYLAPTLVASRGLGADQETQLARLHAPLEHAQWISQRRLAEWREQIEDDAGPLPWGEMRKTSLGIVRGMHSAGVPLLAGTDMSVAFTLPGVSLHDELELLVEDLGVSPMEALRAATGSPGQLFGLKDRGIAPGSIAHLVLLERDPRLYIRNSRTVHAVVQGDRLFGPDDLAQLREHVARHKDDDTSHPAPACSAEATNGCLEVALASLANGRWSEGMAALHHLPGPALDVAQRERLELALHTNRLLDPQTEGAAAPGSTTATDCAFVTRTALSPGASTSSDELLLRIERAAAAVGAGTCVAEHHQLLRAAAEDLHSGEVSRELRPLHLELSAVYQAQVLGNAEKALGLRQQALPPNWKEDPALLRELVAWCIKQEVALDRAMEFARRAQELAKTDIDRLWAMLSQAEVAGTQEDYATAIPLLEQLHAATGSSAILQRLEQYRQLSQVR